VIEALAVYVLQHSDEDRTVEIRLDYPKYDTFTLKFLAQGDETEQ
jgi:hypothetical protein